MRYYIIAGEASGDLHGSDLVTQIRATDPEASIRAWGGDLMEAAGATVVKHYKDLAFMGFAEVVKHLGTILENIRWCKSDILAFAPDAVIFIDYPGFNLRIAKWAKKQDLRCFYYITPQIWAWNTGRAKIIKNTIEQLYAILPFEREFYGQYGMDVLFVGHPLKDRINRFIPEEKTIEYLRSPGKPILALLPGSRKQEIRKMLPIMLDAVKPFRDHSIALAMAPGIDADFYKDLTDEHLLQNTELLFIRNKTYDLLSDAQIALVTSGTATLETALFNVPQIVVYKGSWLSYQIARRVIKVPYISLVNLILEKEVVPELIQNECTPENIHKVLLQLLPGGEKRQGMLQEYSALLDKLGPSGASKRVAEDLIDRIKK